MGGGSDKEKARLAIGTPEFCPKIHTGLLGSPALFPQPHTQLSIINYLPTAVPIHHFSFMVLYIF